MTKNKDDKPPTIKLYLLSRTGYVSEAYDSAVVSAADEESARLIHPSGITYEPNTQIWNATWVPPEDIEVQEIGIANPEVVEGEVICADYQE